MKKRKAWLAFLLSLVCPGLGQLYNGKPYWAFSGLVLSAALTAYSAVYLFDSLNLLLQALFLGFALDVFYAVHAFFQAKNLGEVVLKPYQRWWIYVGFAILVYGLPDGYGTILPQRFRSFQIPSESMVPNLLVGDRLVADGWAYLKEGPKRGDVVVFDFPKDPSVKYVKRVVGIPGDTIEVRSGEVFLNQELVKQVRTSKPIEEQDGWNFVEYVEYLGESLHTVQRTQRPMIMNFGPVTVPEGHYFVMGDNRDRSNDSRVWGFVSRDALIGRMNYIYFSWDSGAGQIRTDRLGLKIR